MSIRKLMAVTMAIIAVAACKPADTSSGGGGGGGNPPPPAADQPAVPDTPPDYIMEVRAYDKNDRAAQGRSIDCTFTGYGRGNRVILLTDARTGATSTYVLRASSRTGRDGTRTFTFYTYGAPDLEKILASCKVTGAEGDVIHCDWYDYRTGQPATLLSQREFAKLVRRAGFFSATCFAVVDTL
jgi:hypothetical protein